MIRKVYYLSNCDTCHRILSEVNLSDDFEFQDVKKDPISEEELEFLKEEIGGRYELLFNKRAKLYRESDLKDKKLTDGDYKNLILEHYSYLKRPIVVANGRVITGNATKIIKEIRKHIG